MKLVSMCVVVSAPVVWAALCVGEQMHLLRLTRSAGTSAPSPAFWLDAAGALVQRAAHYAGAGPDAISFAPFVWLPWHFEPEARAFVAERMRLAAELPNGGQSAAFTVEEARAINRHQPSHVPPEWFVHTPAMDPVTVEQVELACALSRTLYVLGSLPS